MQLPQLEKTLKCLVQGGVDFALFGGKSSGKTTLIKKIMNEVYQGYYVHFNSTIVDERNDFFFLLTFEIVEFLKKLTSYFVDHDNAVFNKYSDIPAGITLSSWLKDMNKVINQKKQIFEKIGRIYFVIDNFEEIRLNQIFIRNFYKACKQRISVVKFSFCFVGTTLYNRVYDLEKPFNTIPTFFMPKPDIRQVISQQIEKRTKNMPSISNDKKMKQYLKSSIFATFETIENQYGCIKQITNTILDAAFQVIKDAQSLKQWKNTDIERKTLDRVKRMGPVTNEHFANEDINTEYGRKLQISKYQEDMEHQRYPNLILTSLFLANGHPQKDDFRRFKDYSRSDIKKIKSKKISANNKGAKGDKIIRHNVMRIMAISEIFEDLSKDKHPQGKPFLIEADLKHHSLDYYGCFEFLKEQSEIRYFGKANRTLGGRIQGNWKQHLAEEFVKNLTKGQIKIHQFIDL